MQIISKLSDIRSEIVMCLIWCFNSAFSGYKQYDSLKGRSVDVNVDEKIMSFGSKYK